MVLFGGREEIVMREEKRVGGEVVVFEIALIEKLSLLRYYFKPGS